MNKSWRQHATKQQLYSHLPPITKTIHVRWIRHAGHCWRRRDELISDILQWTLLHGRAKAGRPARTNIQQLCEDTGCSAGDLPVVMYDREGWWERVRDIRADGTTGWWYFILSWNIQGSFCQYLVKGRTVYCWTFYVEINCDGSFHVLEVRITFFIDGWTLNFFFAEVFMCFHSMNCHFDTDLRGKVMFS